MGTLDRLRTWIGDLLGRGSADDPAVDEPASGGGPGGAAADYECAVCGTPVEEPAGECPLCHSTETVAAGADPGEAETAGSATEHTAAADPTTEATLRETLGEDPLDRHAGKWERLDDGGYRVERPDGGVERTDSRAGARALLAELYG